MFLTGRYAPAGTAVGYACDARIQLAAQVGDDYAPDPT
jgi:hypothetical protein